MKTDVVLLPGLHGSTALFVLFAESFSAPIAARLSQRLSTKVALLVLCNPLVEWPLTISPGIAASFIQSRWIPVWAVALAMTGGDRHLACSLLREVRNLPRDILAARLAAVWSADREDLLTYLQAPVLGIAGSADRLLSPKITEDLMKKVPFAIYAEVSAPHLAAQLAPDQVWAAISEEFESAA